MPEIAYDAASFSAGQACGTRISACIARVAALELVEQARWWNRWRRRLMASALVACAEELESEADGARDGGARRWPEVGSAPLRVVR